MKIMKHSIFIIICLLGLASCNKSPENEEDTRKQFLNDEGLLVKRTFYKLVGKEANILTETTNILTETTFKVKNGDTILHGYDRSFYQNGQLWGEDHYKNGVKSGRSRHFYSDGQLNEVSWVKNGKLDGVGLLYFPDGQIKAKTFWENGKQIGEQSYYHNNGKLQLYSFHNPVGDVIYCRIYNEKEQLISEEGRQTPQLIYKAEDTEFTIGEFLYVTIYAPTPPDSKVDLFVSITGMNGKVIVDSQKVPIKNGKAVYKRELNDPGQYNFKTLLFFTDHKTGEDKTFNNGFEYEVVGE